jgi:hypothetical protein
MIDTRTFSGTFFAAVGGAAFPLLNLATLLAVRFVPKQDCIIHGAFLSGAFNFSAQGLAFMGALVHVKGPELVQVSATQTGDLLVSTYATSLGTPIINIPIHRASAIMFSAPFYKLVRVGESIIPYVTHLNAVTDTATFTYILYYSFLTDAGFESPGEKHARLLKS